MIYIIAILIIVLSNASYRVGRSINTYTSLREGTIVYSKMINPSYDIYHQTSVSVDSFGNKYTTDKDGDKQFLIRVGDILRGDILTEEEYIEKYD